MLDPRAVRPLASLTVDDWLAYHRWVLGGSPRTEPAPVWPEEWTLDMLESILGPASADPGAVAEARLAAFPSSPDLASPEARAALLAELPQGAQLAVVTDGAALGNPGPAGAAFVLALDGREVAHWSAGLGYGTNNIGELAAPIEALRCLAARPDLHLTISTDSQYVSKGITEWIKGWKRKSWRTASGDPVKNRELWEALEAVAAVFPQLRWEWVKGHAGHALNERADLLANAAAARPKAAA